MMMGELDYSGLRERAGYLSSDMQTIVIIVFIIFCITMSLVANNLLVSCFQVTIKILMFQKLQRLGHTVMISCSQIINNSHEFSQ